VRFDSRISRTEVWHAVAGSLRPLRATVADVLQWWRARRQRRWKSRGVTRRWGRTRSTTVDCRALVSAWSLTGHRGQTALRYTPTIITAAAYRWLYNSNNHNKVVDLGYNLCNHFYIYNFMLVTLLRNQAINSWFVFRYGVLIMYVFWPILYCISRYTADDAGGRRAIHMWQWRNSSCHIYASCFPAMMWGKL